MNRVGNEINHLGASQIEADYRQLVSDDVLGEILSAVGFVLLAAVIYIACAVI